MSESNSKSPLERLKQKDFILGLFLPMQEGAWSPSMAPRSTSWTFHYLKECTLRAEALGFDLVFGLAQWLGKGGYGGVIHFREHELDPIVVNASLASLTKSIILINTVHVLYAWHPLHLAKFGAALDHISHGRWGINIVTGYRQSEFRRFGLDPVSHDLRYAMADEFTTIMEQLWANDDELHFKGRFWSTEGGFLAPKPAFGRPIIVNAGSSGAGLEYAAKHSDFIFITSPAGANVEKACAVLPAVNDHVKALASTKYGRKIKTIINPHVICRATEAEAWAAFKTIQDSVDLEAVANFVGLRQAGDTKSWGSHTAADWAVGGNVHIVGSPRQVVDWFVKLKNAGCDGVQVNFFDYLPDLEFFGEEVMPLMVENGLIGRRAATA
jgi:FMNH2-dependent dimethyl sulfone monooxygenase